MHELTARAWRGLPELYRAADEERLEGEDGMPLLRFMSLLGDQAGELEDLLDRIASHLSPEGRWISELSDPATADAAWLGWLAQLAGIKPPTVAGAGESYAQVILDLPTYGDVDDLGTYAVLARYGQAGGSGPEAVRALLLDAAATLRAGSTAAWDGIIQPWLTGTRTVLHDRHFGGDPWALRLRTYAAETPNPSVVAAVLAQARRPAGLDLTWELYGAEYSTIVEEFATYGDVDDLPSYEALQAFTPL